MKAEHERHEHQASGTARDDGFRKRVTLWAAVIGTFGFIVGAWAFTLPMQFKNMRSEAAKDLPRWSVIGANQPPAPSFEEALGKMQQAMDSLGTTSTTAAGTLPSARSLPQAKIDKLRADIEAASKRNTAAANEPTNAHETK